MLGEIFTEEKTPNINRIVETLRESFKNLKIEHVPPRPHDFKGAIVSIEKARQLLRWNPKISFKNGLKEFIAHMEGQKI